jgi:hypothetical protein
VRSGQHVPEEVHVSDYVKPISQCCRREGMHLSKGNRWKGERGKGNGVVGGGGFSIRLTWVQSGREFAP